MDIKEFLKLVYKYRKLVLAIPLITIVATYLFVKGIPKQYKSQAKLSTGLLDPSRQVAPEVPSYSGPDILIKLNQQFTNIIDIMTMPKNMSGLSYRLILHDLRNPKKPFKRQSDDVLALSEAERAEAIVGFEDRLAKKLVLTPFDNYDVKFYNLVKSMGYDGETIAKSLSVSHENNSDFITVEYKSANTLLSVFVVNTLSRDFIKNYSEDLVSNKNQSIIVLDSLLRNKEQVMNAKNDALKNYKINNKVLNLDKQSQIVYQQIVDQENKKNQALIDLQGLQAALTNINNRLNNPSLDKYLGAELSADNQSVVVLRGKLQAANEVYIDGGFKGVDKKKVDSLQTALTAQLIKTNDQYVADPVIAKQTLVQRRIGLSIDLERTRTSIADIDRELVQLNAKFSKMVPFDAGVQKLERDADVATKEYLELLNRFNQTNLDKNIGLRLHLEQEGVPTLAEPSMKLLYLVLSAVASGAICFALLLVIYFFDNSINNRKQLEEATKGKVLGELNYIRNSADRNVNDIWQNSSVNSLKYKSSLRETRFEVGDQFLKNGHKVLGLTRLNSDKFSVFSAASLVYAFAKLDKRVLLIGDDELASAIQAWGVNIDQSFKSALQAHSTEKSKQINFLNRDLGGLSLLENKDGKSIHQFFDSLKENYDLVVVYLDALDSVSDVKEWLLFTDGYLATFAAGNAISDNEMELVKALNNDDKFLGWLINGVKK